MSGYLFTADPGKHHVGWAIFDGNRLATCGLDQWKAGEYAELKVERILENIRATALIELPVASRGRTVDANDLIDVAITVGRVVQALGPHTTVELIPPRDWKGTVDPDVMIERIKNRLAPDEGINLQNVQLKSSLRHNVIDAIGLGLWRLNRLGGFRKI
jgi:hypothetical protein